MDFVIGIDVGTSGTKGLLVSVEGKVEAAALVEYGMMTPRPGWAEQDPDEWWRAAVQVISELAAKARREGGAIKAVGLTGQMHSSVFLDDKGRVIRPALLWCDQRTQAECDEITARAGFTRLVELTANRALTGFTAPKVLWLRNHEPENYGRLRRLLLAKDYVRFRLTGLFATDVSDASGMLLFDVKNRVWSRELLELLGIDPAILPECFESPAIAGRVTAEAEELTGLQAGTPVAAGAVGNGVVREGPVLVTIGTSGVVFAGASRPVVDPEARLHCFCHASPGRWHTMGVMLSAGGSLRWLREALRELQPGLDYGAMNELARKSPPGADGLIFLPYLTGERTPHFDPHARGVFSGLNLKHGLGHLTRAVMEGVAYGIKDSVRLMARAGTAMDVIYLSGGGAKSELWARIIASVLALPLKRLGVDEGPSFGAALLALVGSREFTDVDEAADRTLAVAGETVPVPDWVPLYEHEYERFCALYPALKSQFRGRP